jgi:hypothetical protein
MSAASVRSMRFLSSALIGLLISLVGFGVTPAPRALGQAAQCAPVPSGLVSWWRGEGNASGSVGSNHGTSVGNVAFAAGKVGQAFNFDGTSYVRIPRTASLEPAQITLEAWTKPVFSGRPAQAADVDIIINKLARPSPGYGLYVAMDPGQWGVPLGTPVFYLSGGGNMFSSVPFPNDGLYHHVAATHDGSTMRLFVNGVETANRPLSGPIVHATDADAYIGFEPAFTPRTTRGAVDEVSIYNRALSQAEIQAIHAAGSAGKCGITQPPPSACAPVPAGLVSWWRGEGNANDAVGGKHGTLQGDTTFVAGKVGQGFGLDGAGDMVATPLILPSVGTIEMWVKPTNLASPSTQILAGTHSADSSNRLWIAHFGPDGWPGYPPNSVSINLGSGPTNDITIPTPLANGVWTHLALAYDYVGSSHKLYVNGALAGSSTTPRSQPTGALRIGGVTSDFGQTWFFNGAIDDLSVYNRALSLTEIQAIHSAGSAGKCGSTPPPQSVCAPVPAGLVSWWRGEGTPNDSVGGNHGTLQNGTTFAAGMVGQAFSLDGADDYINVPDPPGNASLNLDYVTVEMWLKPTPPNDHMFPFDKRTTNVWTGEYAMLMRSNGQFQTVVDAGAPSYIDPGDGSIFESAAIVPMNQWSHFAMTWDGSTLKAYINGNLAITDAGSGSVVTNSDPLRIGARADLVSFYKGQIDEFSIYNRPLSQAEIQAIHTAGTAGKCGGTTPPPPPPGSCATTITATTGVTSFCSEATFLTASGATQRVSYPTSVPQQGGSYTENGVTMAQAFGQNFAVGDFTPVLTGNELSVNDVESVDVTLPGPATAFGIRIQDGFAVGAINAAGIDSTFTFTFKNGTTVAGNLTVNPPNDQAFFVGATASSPFDRVEIRETSLAFRHFGGGAAMS